MPIKFVIGHNIKDPEEIDVPRGMNYVNTNDVILLKKDGKNKTYVVDSITHKIDYDVQ